MTPERWPRLARYSVEHPVPSTWKVGFDTPGLVMQGAGQPKHHLTALRTGT